MMRKSNIRFSIVTVKPLRRFFVGFQRLLCVPQFHFVHLGQMLLLRSSTTEVALQDVVLDSAGEHASGVLGVGFAVDLEGFGQGVCCIVGFVEVLGLDGGRLLKGETGFFV